LATDLFHALLPDHLLLGLLLALMLLEMLKADARIAGALVNLTLFTACVILVRQYAQAYDANPVAGEIHVDHFALLAKLVILGCGLLFSLTGPARVTIKSRFLVAASLLGALIVMDSAGFISLFLGIEMLSLPTFALIVHGNGRNCASEGAFKYLLFSSLAAALLLLGIAFAYGLTGTLAIDAFVELVDAGSAPALAAGVLVASGFLLKAAVFPFHGWAPDAYAAARLPVTCFLASIAKGVAILALVRIFAAATLNPAIVAIVAVASLLSIFYGNLAAIKQRGFKRLLAYSSIAHAGYMLFAFVDTTGSRVDDLLWYVGIYASTVIIVCASFSCLCPRDQDDVAALDGAFKAHPAAAVIFGLGMLSLAGLPPLPGFFAKLFVFRSVIASGLLSCAIIAFIGSFIGVTYYLRLFYRLFDTDPDAASEPRRPVRTAS
jgi:NADH-quinone oxidoreductase subunit N